MQVKAKPNILSFPYQQICNTLAGSQHFNSIYFYKKKAGSLLYLPLSIHFIILSFISNWFSITYFFTNKSVTLPIIPHPQIRRSIQKHLFTGAPNGKHTLKLFYQFVNIKRSGLSAWKAAAYILQMLKLFIKCQIKFI